MPTKKKTASSGVFWRILISAVGIALIVITVVNLLLFIFGETASASVSTRRVGGESSGRPVNQRYEWSLDYTFKDQNGLTHSGHTTRRGNDLSVKTDSTVYYFSFAPFISALESEAEPSLIQLLFVGLGIFLLLVMNKKKKKKIVRHLKVVKTSAGEKDMPELKDYDDSVEEIFHEDE